MERPASATQPKHTNIGVVGLGIIGRGIAGHLRRNGFSVFVWNRSPRPVPNFVGSPGELAGLCNYIQIFVSDDDALLQTVEQLSEKLTPRHVIFAHSTVAPDSMRAAADIVERRGARFVEACFTGSKGAAEQGELVYYVGGTDEALREGRPILEASSKEILYIGPVGQASAIKVATNMVSAASVQATAEALALVQAEGLPLEKFVEAMRINASYSGTLAMKLPQIQEPLEQSDAEESIAASAGAETQNVKPQEAGLVASPESVLGFSGTMNAPASAATPLRRGFLRQLLSRFSSGEE